MKVNYTNRRSYRDDHSQETHSEETTKRVDKIQSEKQPKKAKKKSSLLKKVLGLFKF